MRAEFWIKHSQIDPKVLSGNLERTFGLDDRGALKNSEVFNAKKWQDQVLFSREDPSYRIICFRSTELEIQMHVEPVTGNVIRASESAWVGMKKALKNCGPSVTDLKLVDSASNREFMSGRTGLASELCRRETFVPAIIGLAVLLYAIIGAFSFAKDDPDRFLLGSLSGVVAAIVTVSFAFIEARKGVLRWS